MDAACFIVEPIQGEGGVTFRRPAISRAPASFATITARCCRRRGANGPRTVRRHLRVRVRRHRPRRHDPGKRALRRRRSDRGATSAGRRRGTRHMRRRRSCTPRRSAVASWRASRRSPRSTSWSEDGLAENARDRGKELLDGVRAIAAEHPDVIREGRGRGLLVGAELTHEGYGGTIIPEMLKSASPFRGRSTSSA